MLTEKRSVETGISLDPDINTRTKEISCQEGNLIGRLRYKWVNITSSVGLLGMSIVSPIDLPRLNLENNNLVGTGVSRVDIGETESINHLKVLIVKDRRTTNRMVQRVAVGLHAISPLDEYRDITDIYSVDAEHDLGCNRRGQCNHQAVLKVRDDASARTGLIFHEVIALAPGGWNGQAKVESNQTSPSLDTYFAVVLPKDEDIENSPDELVKITDAHVAAHEFGHAVAGFGHEGQDLMDEPQNCPKNDCGHNFNPSHTQFLRELKKLIPHNYYTPPLRFRLGSSLQSVEQVNHLPTMEFNLPATDIPAGTRWVKLWIRQEDGPAITLFLGGATLDQIRRGEYKIEAPDVVNGKSTILLKDQLVTASVWTTNEDATLKPGQEVPQAPDWNSPAWIQHKVWPNLTVPSNEAKATWHTPKSTTTFKNETAAKTADSTPTLKWSASDPTAFYVEVQMSGDTRFDVDPKTATSFVYWNLIHAGETKSTWTVPDNAKLVPGKYYFRIRERVQGSGTPAQWSQPFGIEITPSMLIKAAAEDLVNGVDEKDLGSSVLDECIRPFLPQMPLDRDDIMNPACYRLMSELEQPDLGQIYQQMRDNFVVDSIMQAPKVTLREGSVKVRKTFEMAAFLQSNRPDRRKAAKSRRAA